MSDNGAQSLQGYRILIVEDQTIVAMSMRDMLIELGAIVVGPALTLQSAYDMALVTEIDIAVVDLWMGGERSYPVGEVLQRRGIPFLLTSVADRGVEPPSFRDVPRIMKPFFQDELYAAILAALAPPTA